MQERRSGLCFVIMPFGEPDDDPALVVRSERVYSQWIRPAVEAAAWEGGDLARLEARRADQGLQSGDIMQHLLRDLERADLVIADLSGRNPNVCYELGVRHALGGPTLLITDEPRSLPFDLRGLRVLRYRYDPEGMLAFRAELTGAVAALMASGSGVPSPVQRVLMEHRPSSHAGPGPVGPAMAGAGDAAPPGAADGEVRVNGLPLSALQGVWDSVTDGSTFCIRLQQDRLRVAYRYAGHDGLTAHLVDIRILDWALCARFEWFTHPASVRGFVVLMARSPRQLEGGWWYADQSPAVLMPDTDRTGTGFHPLRLLKLDDTTMVPAWAADYFRDAGGG